MYVPPHFVAHTSKLQHRFLLLHSRLPDAHVSTSWYTSLEAALSSNPTCPLTLGIHRWMLLYLQIESLGEYLAQLLQLVQLCDDGAVS